MNIGQLLRDPFQQLVEEIHESLASEGYPEIRPAHGNVFQFIGRNGARLTEMAAKAQMTKQSMSYLVEYLEKEGHVECVQDETDKRAKIYRLTKKGWKAVNIAEKAVQGFEKKCRKKLGRSKYDKLIGLLTELDKELKA